jgi:hypothetical protein
VEPKSVGSQDVWRINIHQTKILILKYFLLLAILYCTGSVHAQDLLLKNETIIFSFQTRSGKQAVIAKDTANAYIVYRFGTDNKKGFEFLADHKTSWTHFKCSFYLRGGGIQNEGTDLNYLYFDHNSFRYVIYDTYFARGNSSAIGIKVINLKTKKITQIKGIYKTRKGTLTDLKDSNLIEVTDELFD